MAENAATDESRQPTIVVAYNGSPASRHALAYAADLAEPGGTVVVVNVVPVTGVSARIETVTAAERARQRELLREARGMLSRRRLAVVLRPGVGDPLSEVLRAAEESHASVIAAGRGRRGHAGPFHRSFAVRLAGKAPHDVLVAE